MALQIPFFMAPEDERDVLRRLSGLQLELWPELTEPQHRPPLCGEDTQLVDPAYYLAAGDVIAYPLKRGQNRGRWKIDEVKSPVLYFFRSQPDEEGRRSVAHRREAVPLPPRGARAAGGGEVALPPQLAAERHHLLRRTRGRAAGPGGNAAARGGAQGRTGARVSLTPSTPQRITGQRNRGLEGAPRLR